MKVTIIITPLRRLLDGGCCSWTTHVRLIKDLSNDVISTLKLISDGYGTGHPNEVDIRTALRNGHQELQSLYDEIVAQHKDMVRTIRLFEPWHKKIDKCLKAAFKRDVEDGRYTLSSNDYETERMEYLHWVNSHTDDDNFVAERKGFNLLGLYDNMPPLKFVILLDEGASYENRNDEDNEEDDDIVVIDERTFLDKMRFQ